MKLTRHTDYALRVMIYLARPGDGLVSIRQIAGVYGISQNHLMKIVQSLGHAGFVETVRGRHGGLRLARAADQISLGGLVRHTEGDIRLVDCQGCVLTPGCSLPSIFAEATEAFLAVLDRYTLADITARQGLLYQLLNLPECAAPTD
ncbi:transcriptional regulator, BadM/Rrf2 family [Paracoccus alcaliphilus]|uniref:Transcriptional regulator, BadM/Rrf2 family n=1 Tax=Paracoccus alcaliphilus TaxID=34002 RepID=A0A1H8KSV8_9RHOB|nr:Rrf2 family transcriptional regulator [Paracoccus alcaliphilus]WCR20467.1 Rrf2 family transcriptional regulator [Paracoccus alcaliphilus]SEN95964.1 transcriptional regulator, BadM/Rrf2 family [Paracoccus alcaliphilus]